jgi:hypothetical protein
VKLGAFFNADIGLLRSTPKCREDRNISVEPKAIVAPVSGRDHSSVKVEDALQFNAVE